MNDAERLQLDPRQARIHARLALIGPGPAAFYRDAVRILAGNLESSAHLLGHLGREIESSLSAVLLEGTRPKSESGSAKTRNGKTKGADEKGHRDKVERIIATYGLDPKGATALFWLRLTERDFRFALHHQAHRDSLMPPRRLDQEFREFWEQWETLLDDVLDRFESRFTDHLATIKDLQSQLTPGVAEVERLRNRVPNNVHSHTEFFGAIDARWLTPLRMGGFFLVPPSADPTTPEGFFPFTHWPASQYLARLVESADEHTLQLIGEISVSIPPTDNLWVHQDLAAVALKIPVHNAATISRVLVAHVRSSRASRLPERLAQLALRLCKERRVTEGLTALRALIIPTHDFECPIDDYEFELVLENVVPRIVDVAYFRAFAVLCDALERATAGVVARDGGKDDGCSFRPAIEDHRQNNPNTERIASALIVAVRDAAETIAKARPCLVSALVRMLEERAALIFRRLAMHLLRTNPDAAPSDVARFLAADHERETVPLWHERRLLERDGFRVLSPAAQARFMDWITEGPADTERFRRGRESRGQTVSDDDIDAYKRRWRRSYLALLEPFIRDDLRPEYNATIVEFGRAEHPDFLIYLGEPWKGASSPQTIDDLAGMTAEEVLAFLNAWTPQPRFDGPFPSRDGLARHLRVVVAGHPAEYASIARAFRGAKTPYIRAVIEGLTDATEYGSRDASAPSFNWTEVLELAQWILSQPKTDLVDTREALDAGEDPGWNWTRTAIARLLVAGLKDGTSVMDSEDLPVTFVLINELLSDDDSSTSSDGVESAFNTTRGAAIEALISYATHRAVIVDGIEGTSRLDLAPEARQLLEEHIDWHRDASRATRAMLGIHLNRLIALDDTWVRNHLGAILPDDNDALRAAVWDGYLWHNGPTVLAFDVLRGAFKQRVRETMMLETDHGSRRLQATVGYLSTIYLFSAIGMDDVLNAFLDEASPVARAELLKTIGFRFYHDKEEIDPAALGRAKDLWERRRHALTTIPREEAKLELRPFGWWFASGKFDIDWSLRELSIVLNLTHRIELDFGVADRLAELASTHPVDAVRCVVQLVDGDERGWRVLACRRGIHKTLCVALQSKSAPARTAAKEFVARLVARGHRDFADLA